MRARYLPGQEVPEICYHSFKGAFSAGVVWRDDPRGRSVEDLLQSNYMGCGIFDLNAGPIRMMAQVAIRDYPEGHVLYSHCAWADFQAVTQQEVAELLGGDPHDRSGRRRSGSELSSSMLVSMQTDLGGFRFQFEQISLQRPDVYSPLTRKIITGQRLQTSDLVIAEDCASLEHWLLRLFRKRLIAFERGSREYTPLLMAGNYKPRGAPT